MLVFQSLNTGFDIFQTAINVMFLYKDYHQPWPQFSHHGFTRFRYSISWNIVGSYVTYLIYSDLFKLEFCCIARLGQNAGGTSA